MTSDDELERAAVLALSALPEMGPARLRVVLGRGSPAQQWAAIAAGALPIDADLAATCTARLPIAALLAGWRAAAASADPLAELRRHRADGVVVLRPTDPDWPPALLDDPDPPAVLFARGDIGVLGDAAPSAAIVGTRRCSRYGWDVAYRLGADLGRAGIAVVSGLATGIDGAAHRGILDVGGAPPVGVVASGLDVVYPPAHARLWQEVAEHGVLLSEVPLGTRPARWRFPARNRIIAALAGVVVVVESATSGGALHTVDEAVRRDRSVLAVPGPITSLASAGTNRLLADGATPACGVDDVLVALGLGGRSADGATDARRRRPPADPDAARVLDAVGWEPVTFDQLVLRTELGLGPLARVLTGLEADGWVAIDGGWVERRR
jgi:DNA processing protein